MYFYNARYYDGTLGRFLQADTIVPSPANPQSFNRYSYVLNSPCNHVDPSGHCGADSAQLVGLQESQALTSECITLRDSAQRKYGFNITGQWKLAEMEYIISILAGYENSLGLNRFVSLVQAAVQAHDPANANKTLTIQRDRGTNNLPIAGWFPSDGKIFLNDGAFDNTPMHSYNWPALGGNLDTIRDWVSSHELGHIVLDGLRTEHGRDYWYIEATYDRMVPRADAFHPGFPPNESSASELANLAALQVSRPDSVSTWENTILISALQGQSVTAWERGQ